MLGPGTIVLTETNRVEELLASRLIRVLVIDKRTARQCVYASTMHNRMINAVESFSCVFRRLPDFEFYDVFCEAMHLCNL